MAMIRVCDKKEQKIRLKSCFIPDGVQLDFGLARGKTENNKHTKTTPPALYETHTSAVTARESFPLLGRIRTWKKNKRHVRAGWNPTLKPG